MDRYLLNFSTCNIFIYSRQRKLRIKFSTNLPIQTVLCKSSKIKIVSRTDTMSFLNNFGVHTSKVGQKNTSIRKIWSNHLYLKSEGHHLEIKYIDYSQILIAPKEESPITFFPNWGQLFVFNRSIDIQIESATPTSEGWQLELHHKSKESLDFLRNFLEPFRVGNRMNQVSCRQSPQTLSRLQILAAPGPSHITWILDRTSKLEFTRICFPSNGHYQEIVWLDSILKIKSWPIKSQISYASISDHEILFYGGFILAGLYQNREFDKFGPAFMQIFSRLCPST